MAELGMVIHGTSKNGKLCLNPDEQEFLMQVINDNPGNLELIIRKPSKERSTSQNKYYWGVVLALIADYCGHTVFFLHKHFKEDLLGPGSSTKKQSRKDFKNYIDQIIAWAAEWNIIIPDAQRVEIRN